MPTAGKVLSILVSLALVGWIFLASQVSELNRNWGQKLQKLEADIDRVSTEVATAGQQLDDLKATVVLGQSIKEQDLTRLRAELSKVQNAQAYSRETLDRFSLQAASVAEQLKGAEERRVRRTEEKAAADREFNTAVAQVQQLATENQQLLGRLTTLRQDFESLLSQNQQLVNQIVGGLAPASPPAGSASASPRVRPASLSR